MSETVVIDKTKKEAPLSRLGRKPVPIPAGVKVTVAGSSVTVEGKKGKLNWTLPTNISATVEPTQVLVKTEKPGPDTKPLHGLSRKLILNMVEGVTTGFRKRLVVEGVGFRAAVAGNKLNMTLGFSHPVVFEFPSDIKISIDPKISNMVVVEGMDKQRVGQIAASVRAIKKPEPYKGTGIRYENEIVKRKAGKAVAGASAGGAGASGGGKK